jgi:hypothetical protein
VPPPLTATEGLLREPIPVEVALPPLPVDNDAWWSRETRDVPLDEYGRAPGARAAEDLVERLAVEDGDKPRAIRTRRLGVTLGSPHGRA